MLSPRVRLGLLLSSLALLLVVMYAIRGVLLPFVLAFLSLYLLNPLVERLTRVQVGARPLPRAVAVAVVLIGVLGLLAGIVSYLVPALAQEFRPFRQNLPQYYYQLVNTQLPNLIHFLQRTANEAGLEINVQAALLGGLPETFSSENGFFLVGEVQKIVGGFFGTLFRFILVFILTMFLLLDWPKIRDIIANLVPPRFRQVLGELVKSLDRDLSGSIRGQLSICAINFVLTTLGLWVLGVKYALTLGVIAGVFSIIPVFGSIISTLPIVLVCLTVSMWDAVKAVLMIIFIHLIEANILNPKVMGHHVELHPIIILFAIMVGEHLLGPVGLLIGVPIVAALRSLLLFVLQRIAENSGEEPPGEGANAAAGVREAATSTTPAPLAN
ncbi:MAG: AI-2E family transporter [Myxococcota bacterium]